MTEEQIEIQSKILMNVASLSHQVYKDPKFLEVREILANLNKKLSSL
jgi:hypothetical protein